MFTYLVIFSHEPTGTSICFVILSCFIVMLVCIGLAVLFWPIVKHVENRIVRRFEVVITVKCS